VSGSGETTPVEVPTRFDEVTSSWLTGALADGGRFPHGVEIDAVVVEPLGDDVGLLGDLARLRMTYRTGTGPSTLILKLPTSDPGGHQVGRMLRAWAREVAFYREVAPASPGARVPRCYYAGDDPVRERWVLLLEDCPSEPVDAQRGATPAQAEAAVDALAAFHATWWGKDTFDWMPGFDTTGVGALAGVWRDATPRFLERYRHVVPPPTDDWLPLLPDWLAPWSDRTGEQALTVVHADYRLDNLLIAGDRVTMIDWQTALRGPGAMDLSSFIVTSLTIENRRAVEDDLIARYRSGLAREGVDVDPTWLARSYDENLLWWMGQFANNLARLEPADPATQRALDTMIERTYTAALDRDAARLISSGA
jgi:aminoglycoside phosphotransferase (APT) family kinase protein